MTTPAGPLPDLSPALAFPAWYRGGFVDIERLLVAHFSELLPAVEVVSWLPTDKDVLASIQKPTNTVYLRIFRTGGRVIFGEPGKGAIDRCHVQFAALAASRELSWQVIEFVRQVMYAYLDGGSRIKAGGLYAMLTTVGEINGPVLTPEVFRDQRLVPVTFELDTQRRKGLPSFSDYSRELIA